MHFLFILFGNPNILVLKWEDTIFWMDDKIKSSRVEELAMMDQGGSRWVIVFSETDLRTTGDKPVRWLLGFLNELRRQTVEFYQDVWNDWLLCGRPRREKNTRSHLAVLLRIMTVLMTIHTDYFLSSTCAYTLKWCVRRCYNVCRGRPCHTF